ncbi:hypothetical protein AB3G34_00505 [Flavobacterium sp. WC2409]|uniref:POTRA domain-containing protein n=1 Tax=Flavobacterium sp. WC2409 TaxID=3234139 RepID=A0AB39W3D5_9FLAO
MKHLQTYLLLILLSLNCQAQKFQLKISGNSSLETKKIDSLTYSTIHINTKSIENETNLVLEKLSKKGYTESRLIKLTKTNDTSYVANIKIGYKIKYIHIYIGINSKYKKLNLFDQKKDSLIMPYSEIEYFLNETLHKLELRGYAFTKLKLRNITKKNDILFAELDFETENQRKIDKIVIKQANDNIDDYFPKGYLTQINRKYKDKTYNQKTVTLINNDFENLGFATQIKYPEILFTKDSTKIYIYLNKRKTNNFDGFIGFNNNAQNKIVLNGYLDLKLENLLLTGEQFTLYWKSDEKKQKTFKTSLEIPYILNSPIGLRAQLDIFKQDSIYQNTKTAIDIGYYSNYKTRFYLGYQSTTSSDIQNTNTNFISDYKNSFITTNMEYSHYNYNNTLFPSKTILILKLGTGERKTNFKDKNTPTNKQAFININIQHLFSINKKNFINIKNESYYLKSASYNINELYRYGGINSIRGFKENSLQANIMSALLTEYRYLITPQLYIHSILDYSILKDPFNTEKNNKTTKILGTGLGIGALTKGGFIKLSIANGSRKNEEFKFYNTIIHISYNVKF